MSLESTFASEPHSQDGSDVVDNLYSATLETIRKQGAEEGLPYSGVVPPTIAWVLFRRGDVVLVDVRTAEELKFVGHVPGAIHVPWATGTSLNRNPRFLKELENRAGGKASTILLLCRSGNRSAAAAAAATAAGFQHVFNVAEGFEGELDPNGQRGRLGGWRFHGLPWSQD
jgi:rhodanese-related sulfurtransferase